MTLPVFISGKKVVLKVRRYILLTLQLVMLQEMGHLLVIGMTMIYTLLTKNLMAKLNLLQVVIHNSINQSMGHGLVLVVHCSGGGGGG